MGISAKEMNRLLDLRMRDRAGRRPADSLQEHLLRVREDRPKLMRCLGLEPFPNPGELNAQTTGTVERKGYRIEKLVYFSRPRFPVTAHLYLPESSSRVPVIVRVAGEVEGGKCEAIVQASAISLVLSGYAVLVVDAPGSGVPELSSSADDSSQTRPMSDILNERKSLGFRDDLWLSMGAPYQGFYVWDVMRSIDYLSTRPEIAMDRIGITGEMSGGLTAMYAFAADERIACAALVCSAGSLEEASRDPLQRDHLAGVSELGDREDVLALRAPSPLLLVGASEDRHHPPHSLQRTHDKLATVYRKYPHAKSPRIEAVEGRSDYNRRMRETVLAFFDEHLYGKERKPYRPEPRPITDGRHNPCPAETVEPNSPELRVMTERLEDTAEMRSFLDRGLEHSGTYGLDFSARLVPWAKYDRLRLELQGSSLSLVDEELELDAIDFAVCFDLGLSPFELYAQILHIMAPGGIEGWEQSTLGPGGDVVSSLIGSMKALVSSGQPAAQIEVIKAAGPVASMVARVFKCYRPKVEIVVSEEATSWNELFATGNPALIQPLARYLRWPFTPTPNRVEVAET